MTLLTREQLVAIYLKHPNAIGPFDEALKMMREVEKATMKEAQAAKKIEQWLEVRK